MEKSVKNKLQRIRNGLGVLWATVFMAGCRNVPLLDPKGPIGEAQRLLIITTFALMLIVVVPVFILVFWFSQKYRATNTKATYMPKWAYSARIDWVIWLVPVAIVMALAYFTWTGTFRLDPYRQIASKNAPLTIEVVSLDWKWLFIYPEQGIAVVNQLVFPTKVPLRFRLTSDSVMTSFFVPQLGSQMYAMAGMQTRLNLMADEPGVYTGHNQEFSGRGYADMHFKAIATTPEAFQGWMEKVRQSPDLLDADRFAQLRKPTTGNPVVFFSSVEPGLFKRILDTYTGWMGSKRDSDRQGAMDNHPGPLPKAADTGHPFPESRKEG
jgi:cytochrome o ubiquinol oxidase subunit 2